MKLFVVFLAVLIFVALFGYIGYSLMGLGGVDAEAEKAVGLSRLEGADSMVSTLLISVLVVAVIGGLFIAFVLPKIAAKFADFTYNQNTDEFVAPTKLDEARSLVLQGEFERAVKVFREYIGESEVQDRLAWLELARVQEEELEDVDQAIATLDEGWNYEDTEWDMEDDVTFMHRLAELYHEKKGDIAAAEEMYETIIERYEDIDYEVNRAKTALGKLHGVS